VWKRLANYICYGKRGTIDGAGGVARLDLVPGLGGTGQYISYGGNWFRLLTLAEGNVLWGNMLATRKTGGLSTVWIFFEAGGAGTWCWDAKPQDRGHDASIIQLFHRVGPHRDTVWRHLATFYKEELAEKLTCYFRLVLDYEC